MVKRSQKKPKLKVIIDYDGTLTKEEDQVDLLIEKAIDVLSKEILGIPRARVKRDYWVTRKKIMAAPQKYLWIVNGVPACYSHEGAFTLNTTTIQEMVSGNGFYKERIEAAFGGREYDPAAECANYLFHKNTSFLDPSFRRGAKETLIELICHPLIQPIVLTNSKTDKVKRNLETIGITEKGRNNGKFAHELDILGDTRQYHMDKNWDHYFDHPKLGKIQVLPVDGEYQVDLRRPVYYRALLNQANDGAKVAAVGDIFSLVGSVPLMMGYYFILTKTPYVPTWSGEYVRNHPLGRVIESIRNLPRELKAILIND
jgi:hypothetical protein